MNPYHQLVSDYARLISEGKQFPLGGFERCPRPALPVAAPTALIFSPHPDDECIIGGLALRLMREAGFRIVNVAVTQGSKKERQQERLQELQGACDYLGFDLAQTTAGGLMGVNLKTREQDPAGWAASVKVIAELLLVHQPRVIFLPHEHDWNSTHIGTHFLVVEALESLPHEVDCFFVETEFWGQMSTPNLTVELDAPTLADLVTATSFHAGEVRRNPYHLLLPAWMMDNVRRGGELVGGQGGAAPDFTFATLYRLRRWRTGKVEPVYTGGKTLSSASNSASLFE
jgi:N-acetylglucosamine malate deacetylase 1